VISIDIGKTTFHLIGLDARGAIVLRQKLRRGQRERRLANLHPCLIGMEACVGAHHLSRRLLALGHDARLMPARYVRAYGKGQKNDFRDAEAIADPVVAELFRAHVAVPDCTRGRNGPLAIDRRSFFAVDCKSVRGSAVVHGQRAWLCIIKAIEELRSTERGEAPLN
jgi:transposase